MDLTSESKQQDKGEAREAVKKANEALAQELADSMRREWAPLVDNLQKAEDAFDGFDMNDLADDSSAAFDLSRGVWREGGWQAGGGERGDTGGAEEFAAGGGRGHGV